MKKFRREHSWSGTISLFSDRTEENQKDNRVRFYRFPVESRARQFQNASGKGYRLNQFYESFIIAKYALKRKGKPEGFGLLVLLQL